jgi:hypothetical protein
LTVGRPSTVDRFQFSVFGFQFDAGQQQRRRAGSSSAQRMNATLVRFLS